MSDTRSSATNDEDPIQATEQEKSAAFEWLRDVALSLQHDIPISFDGPDHARHAAVALQAWNLSADAAKAAVSETATHTDHPSRHWDRTCPACASETVRTNVNDLKDGERAWVGASLLSAGALTITERQLAYRTARQYFFSDSTYRGSDAQEQCRLAIVEALKCVASATAASKAEQMIEAHNRDIFEACRMRECGYKKLDGNLQYGRECPECPKNYLIDYEAPASDRSGQ